MCVQNEDATRVNQAEIQNSRRPQNELIIADLHFRGRLTFFPSLQSWSKILFVLLIPKIVYFSFINSEKGKDQNLLFQTRNEVGTFKI